MSNPKKRIAQIRQSQKRKRKNLSFKEIALAEKREIARQHKEALRKSWVSGKLYLDTRSLSEIEGQQGIKFYGLIEKLRKNFPAEQIEVLNEGVGRSTLKQELMRGFKNLNVTTTDIRRGKNWPDKIANVMELVEKFGKNRFHMIVSSFGGVSYTPLPEKALFQIVSVLRPRGIGAVSVPIMPESKLYKLAKRLNITIQKTMVGGHVTTYEDYMKTENLVTSFVFTKNIGMRKKK